MDDEGVRRLLAERAAAYAAPLRSVEAAEGDEVLGCRFGPITAGIPIGLVQEVAPLAGWTALSGQRHLLGIVQVRGEVMALVDLQAALGGGPSQRNALIVVLQGRGGRAAVPVDEVIGHRRVAPGDVMEEAPGGFEGRRVTSDLWVLIRPEELDAALHGHTLPGRRSRREAH